MKISLEELRTRVFDYFLDLGAPEEEARAATEMCIDSELREHRSHGVRLLRNIATEYGNAADRRGPISISRETPSSAAIDGGFHLSPFVHRTAIDMLTDKATKTGISMVSVKNAGVSGALGYLVERVASRGLVGIAFNSTPLVVVAPGITQPTIGTNPLAIGLPRPNQTPLVLDMATSAIAFNEVMRRRTTGESLPEGVALDTQGQPTTDPQAAVGPDGRGRVLPFGGHRGYGLALMIELMVSGIVTERTGEQKRGEVIAEPADFGALYLAFDPTLIGFSDHGESNEQLINEIVGLGGRLPGEGSREIRDRHQKEQSVTLDDNARAVLGL